MFEKSQRLLGALKRKTSENQNDSFNGPLGYVMIRSLFQCWGWFSKEYMIWHHPGKGRFWARDCIRFFLCFLLSKAGCGGFFEGFGRLQNTDFLHFRNTPVVLARFLQPLQGLICQVTFGLVFLRWFADVALA